MPDTIDFVAEDEVQPEEIDFQEEVAPVPQFPTLQPGATLADILRQPTPIIQPETGVVRSVFPGVLQPEDLKPSVRLIGGEQVTGDIGDTHPDIIKRESIPAIEIDQRGFQGPQGEFFPREEAAIATGLPTLREPTRLHSTDLSAFQAPGGFEKQLQDIAEAEAPQPLVKLPAAPGIEEVPQTPIERAATAGTKALFGQKIANIQSQVGRELYNLAKSVPEFLTTEEGMLSVLASLVPLGRAGVTGYFTYDMAKTLLDQAKELGGKWDDLSPVEKARSITQAAGTLGLTALLARGAATEGLRTAKQAKAFLTKPQPTVEPVPVKPTEAAVPEVPVAEMAKRGEDIGATHYGRESGKDKFRFTDETKEPGQPNQITFTVPEGASKTEIADARKLAYARDRVAEGIPEENIQVSVNNLGPEFPGKGFVQVDEVRHPKAGNVFSANPEIMRKAGLDMPTSAELLTLPNGNYTLPEVRRLLSEKKAPAEPTATAPVGLPEPKEGTVRVFSGGRGSSWYTTNIKRAGEFAKKNAGILNWVDVPKDVFNTASVAAKEAGSFTEGDALLPNEWVKKSANLRETLIKQAKEKPAPIKQITPEPIRGAAEGAIAIRTKDGLVITDIAAKSPEELIDRYNIRQDDIESTGHIIEGGKYQSVPQPVSPEPELVAMGGAVAGEKPAAAQIEQLTQAMRGVQESKAPLGQQVREAFNIGQRFATAKSAIGQAVSGLKTAGDLLINKWKGVEKIDDLLRAKGRLSQQIEARGWRLRQWEKDAQKAIPDKRDQAAIAKWIDAGGDRAVLQDGLNNAPARFKQAYADALELKGDKLIAAQNVENYFEARLQEAIDAGVLEHGIENYIHRVYESKPDLLKRALAYTQTGLLKTSPSLAKKRVFQFDWEAEKEGYVPVQSFIKRITAYEASLSKAIAAREFIKKASELKAPDGRPIIDIKGVGIPIEDPAGVYREATLIKPKYNPTKNNEPLLPTGAPNPNYRGDYANRDYRALSRWKWMGSDAGGKPIFVQGDVAIHPDYVGRVDALLQPSQVRYGKYGEVLRPALGASSVMKQTMLDLSGFHQVQITVHGMEHRVMPWKIVKDIDLADPNVDGLLRGGVSLGGDYGGAFREGLVGSSLTRLIPGLGNAVESYHQWLFQDYIPRIKMTMALHALERNRERFGETMSEEAIFRKTANQANAAFGELNYIMLERSKTAQDISRLILLAPDFLEARARFALQAFEKGGKRFGNEQRMALLFGALTMWITARIANKIVDGQYHNEPENLFNIVYDGHAYGLRTVQGDILHFLTKPIQFWTSRLNPVYGRTTLEALTGRDYFGRKRSFPEQAWDAVSTVIPISLRSNKERKLWESLLNGFGVTARRWSDVDDAFTLAKKWKETHGVTERGEFIYDPQKDVLRPLKLALNHGDEVGAAKEIKALIDSKAYTIKRLNSYFDRYANMPFAGSFANDKKFKATLTDDQKKTVEAARQHKIEIKKLYQKSRAQYLARPVQDVGAPEVKIDFVETK